jgi:predicted RNase H-like HicB family nuclease
MGAFTRSRVARRDPKAPGQLLKQAFVPCNGLLAGTGRATLAVMRSFTAVIERDPATGLFVGYVPGWPGAHSQGATVDELRQNLEEVVTMLLEDGEPTFEGEFVGTQTVKVA